ncbi:hypothetical protein AWH62_10305 [Maricaulis sp. W15]|uniref:hypothetical protein n=1 Tax=Maricaulis sp. W15 TaxID=1772333 RepID=UPI0009491E3D|nr:hypothetical protein [Maricaulis sp. W15]OLF72227.1 hypothetical protein AWH62_10305 [Maricaulis sp. W15]
MNKNARQYTVRFSATMVLYMAALFGSVHLLQSVEMVPVLRGAVALLPVLPGLAALWVVMVFYRSLDEFKQRMLAEAMIIAALLTGFASFAYGFLEGALDLPTIPLIWVFPVMIGLWGLAGCFQKYVVYR